MRQVTKEGGDVGGRIGVVLHCADYDRIHYGLTMAAAAAALGRVVTVMCAGPAIQLLTREGLSHLRDSTFRARGAATVEDLFAACVDLDVRFIACDMALRVSDLAASDLRRDAPILRGGAAALVEACDGAPMFV